MDSVQRSLFDLPGQPPLKKCRQCERLLPYTADFFPRCNQYSSGLRARCRECMQPKVNRYGRERARRLRYEVLSHYSGGGKPFCVCCGVAAWEFLALDHLEGSSRADYARFSNSERLFSAIINDGFRLQAQTVCHNCNQALARFGVCPHRPDIVRPIKTKRRQGEPPIPADHTDAWQTCVRCQRSLPLTADFFHRNKPMPTGFTTVCRTCDNARRSVKGYEERERIRLAVLAHYSRGAMRCECCSESHPEMLTLDHPDGDGQAHRAEVGEPLYRALHRQGFPETVRLRVLCANCNLARGFFGRCPCQPG